MTDPKVRPSIDEYLMSLAQLAAARSTCTKSHPTGAVAAIGLRVIATGYNGVPSGMPHCDETGCVRTDDGKHAFLVHAEENLVAQCAASSTSMRGATVYVTHYPCPHCAAVLAQAGVVRVVVDKHPGDVSSLGAWLGTKEDRLAFEVFRRCAISAELLEAVRS